MTSWGKSLQQCGVFITKRVGWSHRHVHGWGVAHGNEVIGWCIYMPRMLDTMSIPAESEKKVINRFYITFHRRKSFLHLDLSLQDSRVIEIHFLLLLVTYKILALCYSIIRKLIQTAIVFSFSAGYESEDSCYLLPRETQVTPQSTTGHVASDAERCLQLFA